MELNRQLQWFHDNQGTETTFPESLDNGEFLATRAKGIYKPAGSQFALSVRTQMNSKYNDGIFIRIFQSGWAFAYHQETDRRLGSDLFTNKALEQNILHHVPVGVLEEFQNSEDSKKSYFIHGLAMPVHKDGNYFILCDVKTAQEYSRIQILNAFYLANAATVSSDSEEDLSSISKDLRMTTFRSIVVRQGQGRFRKELIDAYNGKCAVTGELTLEVLDAAHIMPYLGRHTNKINNGILIRTDLHNLFDFNLISIEPSSWRIEIHPSIVSDYYRALHGLTITLPKKIQDWPSKEFIEARRVSYMALNNY